MKKKLLLILILMTSLAQVTFGQVADQSNNIRNLNLKDHETLEVILEAIDQDKKMNKGDFVISKIGYDHQSIPIESLSVKSNKTNELLLSLPIPMSNGRFYKVQYKDSRDFLLVEGAYNPKEAPSIKAVATIDAYKVKVVFDKHVEVAELSPKDYLIMDNEGANERLEIQSVDLEAKNTVIVTLKTKLDNKEYALLNSNYLGRFEFWGYIPRRSEKVYPKQKEKKEEEALFIKYIQVLNPKKIRVEFSKHPSSISKQVISIVSHATEHEYTIEDMEYTRTGSNFLDIWLGQPLNKSPIVLFTFKDLKKAFKGTEEGSRVEEALGPGEQSSLEAVWLDENNNIRLNLSHSLSKLNKDDFAIKERFNTDKKLKINEIVFVEDKAWQVLIKLEDQVVTNVLYQVSYKDDVENLVGTKINTPQ